MTCPFSVLSNSRHIPNYSSIQNDILIDKTSVHPDIDAEKAKQTNYLEMFLRNICGECEQLRTMMLNGLLVLVTESDWARATILDVEYIKPLEEYCEKTEPCDLALQALTTRCKSDSETRSFLRTLKVPSGSTDSSSELVPFAGRLCSTLAEHVSEMKSLFSESSPSDGTISAISASLPAESSLLNGNAVLEMLCEELSLLGSLLSTILIPFENILVKDGIVPLFKSNIVFCLDLLEHENPESNCPPSDRTNMIITILHLSWDCGSFCLSPSNKSLYQIVVSTFSDVPQLCSLLERTSRHSSPTTSSHLRMIANLRVNLPHLLPQILEENLVERVIDITNPIAVPATFDDYHVKLIWAITNLITNPQDITQNQGERKRVGIFLLERVLQPAKQYLQFILQREEFIPDDDSSDNELQKQIGYLLNQILLLERDLFEVGEIVETGREEWEVGWLVEKTKEKDLGVRLKIVGEDDVKMRANENERWMKRVERRREAGHEDAMEGWLTRRDWRAQSKIVAYRKYVSEESGMNYERWEGWRYNVYWM
ncbi:hypothetical protein BLNAU_5870 [Blattamonas nauphoetae]|uniref:Uncharacterized protein n=1 Tax=Blattamonas nauphoetae TaxID=2049346 RepID=A0ABQ9Y5V9_9EUKA|nr:hypothetical protein BLNAU_5870 [Blattamonas nauphoetae]